jgi:DNA polymerase III gamma/tau subunit
MVGNVNQIRDLKPVFEMSTEFYRVIVLDEAQLISRQAQAACLKVIEEGSPTTFFVLCSTDPDMILDTIHSRSLPVDFFKVDGPVIKDFLKGIYKQETGLEDLTDDILSKIAFKSDGHVRDAVMLLEGYMVSNDEAVLALPLDGIAKFLMCLSNNDGNGAVALVRHDIMKHPTYQIQKSLNYLVMQLVSSHVMGTGPYLHIAQAMGERSMSLFRLVSENWVQGVFDDKYLTVSFFLSLVKQFIK